MIRYSKVPNQLSCDCHNKLVIKNGTFTESAAKPKCFLTDDSILGHTGKTIEGISKVHDYKWAATVPLSSPIFPNLSKIIFVFLYRPILFMIKLQFTINCLWGKMGDWRCMIFRED